MKMSISGKDKEGTDRSILENNNKNNSKNNSDNRNNNSTQFKVAFITQLFCLTIAASDQYSSE